MVSEPDRPSVVVSPDGARPMKPVTTGTTPCSRSRAERPPRPRVGPPPVARGRAVPLVGHEERPGVDGARRDPEGRRAAATSGAESRSPKEATRSVTRGVRSRRSETPESAVSSSARGGRRRRRWPRWRRRCRPPPPRAVRAARRPLLRAGPRRPRSASWAARGGRRSRPPSPRRPRRRAAVARRREDPGGADDPLGVAERRPPELVDDDGPLTHSRRGALSRSRRASAGEPSSAPSGRRRGRC